MFYKKFLLSVSLFLISASSFAAAAAPARWKAYEDKENAFNLRYPSFATVSDQPHGFYLVNDKCWSLIAQCTSDQVANTASKNVPQKFVKEITLLDIQNSKANPQSLYIGVHIGKSTDPKDVANCTNAPGVSITGQVRKTSAFVNQYNIAFTVIPFDDAGMSKYLKGESYRIVHDKACWSIDRFQTGVNGDMNPKSDKDLSQEKIDELYNQTLDIINTFNFIH